MYFVLVFTCFIVLFSYKFVVLIYDLYMLGFILDFVKLYCDETYVEFLTYVFCDEINNGLFNRSVLYFVNFIAEFQFSVNV
jgi:hypothetical protein